MTAFETELRALIRAEVRDAVREAIRGGDDMVNQSASPLGRKRHAAAVRRRVAAGESGAAIVGRDFLLNREALAEELAAQSKRPRKSKPAPVDEVAALAQAFGLRRVS